MSLPSVKADRISLTSTTVMSSTAEVCQALKVTKPDSLERVAWTRLFAAVSVLGWVQHGVLPDVVGTIGGQEVHHLTNTQPALAHAVIAFDSACYS